MNPRNASVMWSPNKSPIKFAKVDKRKRKSTESSPY